MAFLVLENYNFVVSFIHHLHKIEWVREMIKCNAVLQGGGVKGIGHVGAVYALEQAGYEFSYIAGSSAGAIVAALLAADYDGNEMHELMKSMDYLKFAQEDFLDHLGTSGKLLSILFHYGIYSAEYLEHWLNTLLEKKHTCCFKDVKNEDGTYRLQVTTVDLTTQELLVLPQDLKKFHIDVDSFPIATAVRMSMSIPIFYEPYKIKDIHNQTHYLVDGGLISNYPIWILDDGTSKIDIATFGFKFIGDASCACKKRVTPCDTIIEYVKLIVSTLLDANDNFEISNSRGDRERSILIPSIIQLDGEEKKISTTDFDITQEESEALFQNGKKAGENFIDHWDFARWLRNYRSDETKIK